MAFDLVAKLKLQDDFTSKIQRVGKSLDKVKTQVDKASKSSSDMGKKFTTSGTAAAISIKTVGDRIEVVNSSSKKLGDNAQKGLSKAAKSAGMYRDSVGKLRNENGKFVKETKNMQSVLLRVQNAGKNAFDKIGKSAKGLPGKIKSSFSKMGGSINGIRGPANSARNAIIGIGSAVGAIALVSKAFNILKASIDGAVSRYDTLNNFPKVMEQIGFSTDQSKKSIERLSEGIDGLPTALDEVASTTQRIATMTGDLDGATETTIALNNALMASGSDAEKASRGTEQYIKMLSSGKVDLESFKTLQETMGLGLNKMAESFGFAGKSAQNDLYSALKDGNITFDQFNAKLIELSEGTGGFADVARNATGGLRTSFANVKTAIVRGLTGSIEAIDEALGGVGSIEKIFKGLKGVVSDSFGQINKAITIVVRLFKQLYDITKPYHDVIKEIGKALVIFSLALGGLAFGAGIIAGMTALFGLLASPITMVVLGIAALATGFIIAYQKIEPFRDMVKGLFDGMSGSLEAMGSKVETVMGGIQAAFKMITGDNEGGVDLAKKLGMTDEQIEMITSFSERVKGVFESLKEAFGMLRDKFAEVVEQISPKFQSLSETFEIVKEALMIAFDALWSFLSPIFSAIGIAIGILGDVAVIAFNNIIIPAVKWAGIAFGVMWKIIGPILKLFAAAIEVALTVLKVMWDNILKPFISYLSTHFAAVLETSGVWLEKLGKGFDGVGGFINTVTGYVKTFADALKKVKIPDWVTSIGGKLKSAAGWAGNIAFGGGPGVQDAGEGRYHGIDYVPRDNKPYRLHKGEAVLTAKENKDRQQGGGGGRGFVINMNGTVIREEADIDRLASTMVRKFIAAGEGGA